MDSIGELVQSAQGLYVFFFSLACRAKSANGFLFHQLNRGGVFRKDRIDHVGI